jgi:hypothetical protein
MMSSVKDRDSPPIHLPKQEAVYIGNVVSGPPEIEASDAYYIDILPALKDEDSPRLGSHRQSHPETGCIVLCGQRGQLPPAWEYRVRALHVRAVSAW